MIHFISGLPRAGSTLLSSLLRQNPNFSAHMQSPLGQIITTAQEQMSMGVNESAIFLSEEQRARILQGIFSGYYHGYPDIVFDSNRRWCSNMPLLARLFPGSKVIACVRPCAEIIDSFERLFQRDPTQVPAMLSSANLTLDQRIAALMQPMGVVGYSWSATREAYFGPFSKDLLVVDFDNLVREPLKVLKDLHNALQIDWFDYDLKNIISPSGVDFFDRLMGIPSMHHVSSKMLPLHPLLTVLPQHLVGSFPPSFW
jgi:sulfotransferase